jgi:hypothetical protein
MVSSDIPSTVDATIRGYALKKVIAATRNSIFAKWRPTQAIGNRISAKHQSLIIGFETRACYQTEEEHSHLVPSP